MQIHWIQFPEVMNAQRASAEERLRRLELEDRDLGAVRIIARPVSHARQTGQLVKLTGRVRGQQIVASGQRAGLGHALGDALESFEKQLHRLRERRREERTAPSQLSH
jgi:ribosomal subunit interface protein